MKGLWSSSLRAVTALAVLVTLALGIVTPLAAAPAVANDVGTTHFGLALDVEGGGRIKLWVCIAVVLAAAVSIPSAGAIAALIGLCG